MHLIITKNYNENTKKLLKNNLVNFDFRSICVILLFLKNK